jgi:hypothetical protein
VRRQLFHISKEAEPVPEWPAESCEGRTEEDDEVLCLHDYAPRKMKRRMRRLTMESFVSLKVSVCCLCIYQHSH